MDEASEAETGDAKTNSGGFSSGEYVQNVWKSLYGDAQSVRPYVARLREGFFSYTFPQPLALAPAKRSAKDEAAVHLAGSQMFFHRPDVVCDSLPTCPSCKTRTLAFSRMCSTSGVRQCFPRHFVAPALYKFSEQCKKEGCDEAWVDKGGGRTKTGLWSYTPEVFGSFPDWVQAVFEKEVVIDGQGTAYATEWHDLFMFQHGSGVSCVTPLFLFPFIFVHSSDCVSCCIH